MADNPPGLINSPYFMEFVDNQTPQRRINITVTFNNSTRAITGATVYRDADCQWRRVMIGLGDDGTPDSSVRNILVPSGTTNISAAALSSRGLDTIEDIRALQITAGP